jgi:RimJ/RimL family protein N-acetyltransferase
MNPRSFCKTEIKNGKEIIGYIQLVKYQRGGLPHIEYSLIENYWNQKIMSVELPKFLKKCKKLEIPRLIAMVKQNNKASIRLLENNKFIKIATFDDKFGYVLAQDLMLEIGIFNKKAIKSMGAKNGS